MPRYQRMGLRDTILHNKSVLNAYDVMAGVESKPLVQPLPKHLAKREPKPRTEPRERVNLRDILNLLRTHPKVAFAWRMQSGVFHEGERYIKVGVVGIPDVLGALRNGRLFGCEVKARGGRVSSDQQHRIDQIRAAGGLAFVAWSVDDVLRELQDVDLGSQWASQR